MKKLFKNIKNKVEMKFLDIILAKILDRFKLGSPKLYAIVMLITGSLHVLADTWIKNFELFVVQNPEMTDHLAAFEGVNPVIAQIVYYLSLATALLSGSRTTSILMEGKKE